MWPERPACHDSNPHAVQFGQTEWRPPHAGETFRTCSYCGSIHPADLMDVAGQHELRLDMADWKYGWPHKYYVEGIPAAHAKWYNAHLADLEGEAFTVVADLIEAKGGIRFERDGDQLKYRRVTQ